jgi:hypothetical protein
MRPEPVPVVLKAPPHGAVKAPPAGTVPHPRRPRLVPDIHGNELMDLFEFFPDLPRVPRPRARLPIRRLRRSRLR